MNTYKYHDHYQLTGVNSCLNNNPKSKIKINQIAFNIQPFITTSNKFIY